MEQERDERGELERAVADLRAAHAAVAAARERLTAVIVAQYRAGVPVAELAERTDKTPVDIRNLLDAAGW